MMIQTKCLMETRTDQVLEESARSTIKVLKKCFTMACQSKDGKVL